MKQVEAFEEQRDFDAWIDYKSDGHPKKKALHDFHGLKTCRTELRPIDGKVSNTLKDSKPSVVLNERSRRTWFECPDPDCGYTRCVEFSEQRRVKTYPPSQETPKAGTTTSLSMASNQNPDVETLNEALTSLESTIQRIPSPDPPPRTTLQIQGDDSSEGAWQNYLRYFLDPTAPHGLGTDALNQFLQGLSEHVDGTIPVHASEDIIVETEALSPSGNQPDLLIHEADRFFICCELKLYASEGENQTVRYADDDNIGDTAKDNFPEQGHHYVYLKRRGHRDAASPEFVNITWKQVKDWLTPLLFDDRGRYPSRTTAQLSDFLDTIQQDMTEDEHIKTERAKMELYLQHQEAIEAARQSFKTIYEHERDNWRRRFLREYTPESWGEDWNCNSNRYGHIYHSEWRPEEVELEDATFDLQFVHLIRELESFKEGKLTFQLRWPRKSPYRERFKELFVSDGFADVVDPILEEHGIEKRADYSYSNPRFTEKVYPVAKDDLPESYFETLSQAVAEHHDLAPALNEIFSTATEDVERGL